MTSLPARPEFVPASLLDVADTLGLSVALKLIAEFGGQELKFPRRPRPDHPIVKALGETDGYAVCEFLSGSMIYVPHGRSGANRRAVEGLAEKGHSRGEIARILGISQRHVRRLANGEAKGRRRQDDQQGSLFEE